MDESSHGNESGMMFSAAAYTAALTNTKATDVFVGTINVAAAFNDRAN